MTLDPRQQEAILRAQALNLSTPRFERHDEMLIAGFNETYTFQERMNIPAQWERFAPHIGKVAGQIGQTAYGVLWNYKPPNVFDYLAGVEVRDTTGLPTQFTHVRLPAQQYVMFTHNEHVSSLAQTMDVIWTQWVPTSGYKPVSGPSFERYTEAFNPQTGRGGMEIWIPVE